MRSKTFIISPHPPLLRPLLSHPPPLSLLPPLPPAPPPSPMVVVVVGFAGNSSPLILDHQLRADPSTSAMRVVPAAAAAAVSASAASSSVAVASPIAAADKLHPRFEKGVRVSQPQGEGLGMVVGRGMGTFSD